jgi:glycerol-3-phosphate dehydrogenase (NAD(P)+)
MSAAMPIRSVAVLGGGSWGTAFALLCERHGAAVRLVCHTRAHAEHVARDRVNPLYLPGVRIPEAIEVVASDQPSALSGVDLVALAIPSRVAAGVAEPVAAQLSPGTGVVSLTKGLDTSSGRRLSELWRDALGAEVPFAVLSGPNHAEEVAGRQPTAAVVAGDRALGERLQRLLNGPEFRVYLNDDLVGVELCAAAKNVIAIAAGMADGLGFGDNAKATLITRGLAEMTRLGRAYGANDATFRGLAGMGDLVGTCTSAHSRNRRVGELIATGMSSTDAEARLGQVAEGLWSVERLLELADRAGVELPISREVAAAVAGKPVVECMRDLMARAPATEQ